MPSISNVARSSPPDDVIDEFARSGFSKLPAAIGPDQLLVLQEECERVLGGPRLPLKDLYRHGKYQSGVFEHPVHGLLVLNVYGLSPRLDAVLEEILTHPDIRGALTAILGSGYKLWQATIRKSDVNCPPLNLHQDRIGESGMSICVSDASDGLGTTVFLPGSHRWPIKIPFPFTQRVVAPFLRAAKSAAGDVYFFSNRTWHGRAKASAKSVTNILLAFYPARAVYPIYDVPPSVLSRLGPEMRRLLDPSSGVEPADNGFVRVVPVGEGHVLPARQELRDVLVGNFPMGVLSPWRLVSASVVLLRGLRKVLLWVRDGLRSTRGLAAQIVGRRRA